MILRRCVVSAFLVFFSRDISFCKQKHRQKSANPSSSSSSSSSNASSLFSCKRTKEKKKKISLARKYRWVVLFKRRDFETTRFSFSFLLRTKRREKKDTFETKRIISSSSEESARFERTQTHTNPEREREKKTTLFSSSLIELFVYFVFVLFARTTEREKERRHFIISPSLIKEREREHRD